jgi:hypothetical protein
MQHRVSVHVTDAAAIGVQASPTCTALELFTAILRHETCLWEKALIPMLRTLDSLVLLMDRTRRLPRVMTRFDPSCAQFVFV